MIKTCIYNEINGKNILIDEIENMRLKALSLHEYIKDIASNDQDIDDLSWFVKIATEHIEILHSSLKKIKFESNR
ncbi:hypothetical protein BST86_14270 [Nonlabens agnitus]|uniref:Uncharacterized protein n=1 Tax=Nonlabens agnitus TaxID=870484 RepID=A0A2S9WXI4_9FLAO|nr:hypothetical protein BST86_14270 [Nonlabens agnitus]